eukprot:3817008-Pyramimonas_sp.AAC.2
MAPREDEMRDAAARYLRKLADRGALDALQDVLKPRPHFTALRGALDALQDVLKPVRKPLMPIPVALNVHHVALSVHGLLLSAARSTPCRMSSSRCGSVLYNGEQYSVDTKGYGMDVKGYRVDGKG